VIVAIVLAVVLVIVIVVAAQQVRAGKAREAALERDRARLEAEGEDLRARLAERVREVEALTPFRPLVEAADDWIWASDDEGTLIYSNAAGAKLLGIENLTGRSLSDLTHTEDKATGWNGVVRRVHADGGLRTVDTRSVRTEAGWQGIDRDLSAPAPEPVPQGVAVVRWPVVDGRREVVAYELVGDGDVLQGFPPAELLELGGGRPVWVTLDGEDLPALDPMRTVLQIGPDTDLERARALAGAGFVLALDGFEGASPLLEHCGIVKVTVEGHDDEALTELIHGPAERGLELVATGVGTSEDFTRCRVLGFSHFQGEFFARPSGEGGGGSVASLQALSELAGSDASFEELERIIGADVGLSLALLRHVNSAFFALPRKIDTVREALTLLGTRAVRRWATVVALSSMPEAPDQLVALALLRGRMCELLARSASEDERERLFTVGLFSVADALLDTPMEKVLEDLPFSEEIVAALLRYEGRLGRVLATVLRYEQGHFPSEGDATELAHAYLAALKWADGAGRWIA
jgi:EAL and modified HD-GYP domain-containing signal transduction protein